MEVGACAENDDEVVLCTQTVAAPLNGVVALVDVRGQCENRFRGIAREVEKLGGKAVSRFTSDITHVIFQNGKTHVKEKADKKGIPVVSVLWLESCRQTGEIASEAKYPVIYNESTPVILGKLKRMKSMQPKSFDEQLSRSIERAKQRRVKGMQKATYHSPGCKVLCEDTQASSASPLRPHTRATQLFIPDTEPIESPDEVQVPTASLEVQSNFYGFTYKDIEKDENLAKSREQESMDPSQKLNFNDSGSSGLVCAVGDSPSTDLVSHPPQELAVTQTPTTSRMPEASVKSKRKLLDRNQLLPFDGQEKPEWTDIQKLSKKSKRNQSSVKIESKPKRPKKCKEVVDGEGQCDVVLECDENESQQLLRKKDRNSLNLFEAPKKWRQANGLNHRPVLKSSSKKKKGRKSGEVTQATNGSNKALKSTRSLVMTSVSSKDRELVVSVAQELGGFTVDSCVSESTTHVVFTQPRRTLNVLMGIARGCWLVSIDWVYKSVETGCWVEEKSYELDGAFPAAKVSREKRFASSGPYNSQIFASCPPIFISEDANPPVEHLSQLVALCGGKLTLSRRRENVLCVGKLASRGGVWLSEQWIMDCIAQGRLMPVTEYGLRDSTK